MTLKDKDKLQNKTQKYFNNNNNNGHRFQPQVINTTTENE